MQTEYSFTLPRGYIDAAGQLHRDGVMRLALALDEIEAVRDPRVQADEVYLPVLLLSRVVTQLGAFAPVPPEVMLGLFAADLAYLEDMYERLNALITIQVDAVCPHCTGHFSLQVAPLA